MTVVEEEMQRGQMGRTQPTRKGRDLGTRKRWESKMAPEEVGGTIQNQPPASRAGLRGRGRAWPDLFLDMLMG